MGPEAANTVKVTRGGKEDSRTVSTGTPRTRSGSCGPVPGLGARGLPGRVRKLQDRPRCFSSRACELAEPRSPHRKNLKSVGLPKAGQEGGGILMNFGKGIHQWT